MENCVTSPKRWRGSELKTSNNEHRMPNIEWKSDFGFRQFDVQCSVLAVRCFFKPFVTIDFQPVSNGHDDEF
jgi:hypothetical protein